MRRRRGEDTLARVRGQLPVAALAFVVLALLGLAFAPIAVLQELDEMRARTAATSERAQSLITDIRLYFAEGVDYHQALRLGQPGSAERYRQVRKLEDAAFDTLDRVTQPVGAASHTETVDAA